VAAHAYALLGRWREPIVRRVVLLGPAHRVALGGLAAPIAEAFETPLGEVVVDLAALAGLDDLPQVVRSDRVHEREHSLEVQLPFLQTVLGSFTLVPLVVGDADAEAVAQVIERLWGGDETLVVISSDLSHYLRYEQARTADQRTVQRILAFDAGLGPHEACGAAAINGALLTARHHGLAPRLLALCNSGDTAGDRDRVVGYGAIAFEEASG
jgi:AmmeMemoRadiSam system protein B